jgi:hypothetical protein
MTGNDQSKYIRRTFYVTRNFNKLLDDLTVRLAKESGIDISMGKILELVLLNVKNKSLKELLNIPK